MKLWRDAQKKILKMGCMQNCGEKTPYIELCRIAKKILACGLKAQTKKFYWFRFFTLVS